MKKGKFLISMLSAAALAITTAFSVSAGNVSDPDGYSGYPIVQEEAQLVTDHIIPSPDPDFEEMTLEEFQARYPDYTGIPDPRGDAAAYDISNPGYITEDYDPPYEWVPENGKWFLYGYTGTYRRKITSGGWYKEKDYWYLLYPANVKKYDGTMSEGEMAVGWEKVGNYWYYFNSAGQMTTYWRQINNVYYYFSPSGADAISGYPEGGMVTGAYYLPVTKGSPDYRNYYFASSGAMQDWYYPVSTSYLSLSSCFNDPRPNGNHQGIDIKAPSNVTITSATPGTVYQKGADLDSETGMGYYCKVNTGISGHRNRNLGVIYMHMVQPCTLTVGSSVSPGSTVIGKVGSTGASTGPHLHFQVTYKGDMGTTALSNSVNPSAFFSETLIPDAGCDVPAYGRDYNYATGEFDK